MRDSCWRSGTDENQKEGRGGSSLAPLKRVHPLSGNPRNTFLIAQMFMKTAFFM